jgi:hypothetical protein
VEGDPLHQTEQTSVGVLVLDGCTIAVG